MYMKAKTSRGQWYDAKWWEQPLVQGNTGHCPRDSGSSLRIAWNQNKEQVGMGTWNGREEAPEGSGRMQTKARGKIPWLPVLLRDGIIWNQ